jgi:hypothetical protein
MSYLTVLVRRLDERDDRHEDSEEVGTMAATIDIEIESGVFTAAIRRHQGYYAGDFSSRPLCGDTE